MITGARFALSLLLLLGLFVESSGAQTSRGSDPLPSSAAEVGAAREKLHRAYSDRLESKDRVEGGKLVHDLRELASRAEKGSATHYVLLEECVLTARRCHDAPLLLEAFDNLLEAYDLELAPTYLWAFEEYDPRDDGPVSGVRIAERHLKLARTVARNDGFESAERLLDIVSGVAKSIGSKDLRERVKRRQKELGEWRKLEGRASRARAGLARDPSLVNLHFDLARYLLAVRDDWEGAREHLAHSPNAALAEAVATDLALEGADGGGAERDACLELARAWRILAGKESRAALREGFYTRAERWYEAALELTPDVFARDELADERDEILAEFGPPVRFLADLAEVEVHAPLGVLGKDGYMGLDENQVQVGGRACLHSLALHAGHQGDDATIRYHLGRAWNSLRGAVALNDTSAATFTAPLVFHLLGDGNRLWSSKPITRVAHLQEFSIRVKGVKTLELRIECRGLNRSAHSIWVEPVLER